MKKLNILVITALVLGLGVAAQAQNFAEVKLFTTPEDYAREGGKNEAAGAILLNTSDQAAIEATGATITLSFSVPLAADIATATSPTGGVTLTGGSATLDGMAENDDDNDGNGTIVFSSISLTNDNLLIQGVKLDVSGADGAVTVTVSLTPGENDFIRIDGSNSAMVISGIKVGVAASARAATVRTRGTTGTSVSLTLKESFKGAFMTDNMVTVEFSGIPEGATLDAMVTSNYMPPDPIGDADPISETTPYATVGAVKDGSATVTLGGNDGTLDRPTPASVTLGLTLTADPGDDEAEISFPLDVGSIMAKATFTDPAGNVDNFANAFTDYVTVFNIRPAQCEMLFPLVTYIQGDGETPAFNTGLAIVNPAYGKDSASGHITFTFYKSGIEPAVYETHGGSPGLGLGDDGRLEPGGTYTVNANELLAAANWAELSAGHVHVLTDYTNCNGLGLIYGAQGIDQSYTAIVLDADTGMDTHVESGE